MKIYTRNGDKGETGLLGAVRVSKSHLVVETCGTIDEVNSYLGCVVSHLELADDNELADVKELDSLNCRSVLIRIQSELFDMGSRVAAALSDQPKTNPAAVDRASIERIESWIDGFDAKLPPLTRFILPGGSMAGSQLHLARTVCRRAERRLVSLVESGIQRDLSADLIYLNRLSDLLFVLARFANQEADREETPWTAFTEPGPG